MFAIHAKALSPDALRERWLALAPVMPEEGRAELDEYGELLLAPLPPNRHQRIAAWMGSQRQNAVGGETGSYTILTRIGVRVPDDMCWTKNAAAFETDPSPLAPEICIEVASPGNTPKWLLEKAAAYLAAGASEVIIVELDGRFRYYDANGERDASAFGLEPGLPPA